MSNVLIKKTGTGYEVSNGTVTVSGSNRAQLLALIDTLEGAPASLEKIQEKVEKAAKVTKKKVEQKKVSGMQKVRDFIATTKGKVTITQVAEATGLSQKYAANYLWNLWNNDEIKSTEKGIYSK
jgi:response regulator of citrate/malate metabolism